MHVQSFSLALEKEIDVFNQCSSFDNNETVKVDVGEVGSPQVVKD